MTTSSLICPICFDAGGWCGECGAPDCDCSAEHAAWIVCTGCSGGAEAPEHVDAELPVPQLQPADASTDMERELVQLRGELARERRYIAEQQHVSLCTAATLERVQNALDAMQSKLQAAPVVELLGASAPYLQARTGLIAARAQLTSGLCAHTRALLKSEQQSTTNRQPARVIAIPVARKAQ